MVCIDEEIPFEIPSTWEWCRLIDVGITETGTTPSKTHPEYFGDYIPFLGPANILEDKVVSVTQGLSEIGMGVGRVVPSGSILQVCIGGSIGKCAIVNKKVTFNQQINSITPIECDIEYVHYVLQSETFRLAIMEKATGTATPIINRGNWEQLFFPLPPLKEQIRIVQKFHELKEYLLRYATAQTSLENLNEAIRSRLRKSILQEAIQGKLVFQYPNDESASVLLQRIKEEKLRLVKEGKLKKKDVVDSFIFKGDDNKYYEKVGKNITDITEDIPFEIPESWEWCRLGDICELIGGYAFPSESLKGNSGIRVIRISDISENGFVNNHVVRYNGHETLSAYSIKIGDILMAMTGGTVGKSLYVTSMPEEMLLNQRVAIIRNSFINTEYINYVILAPHIKETINDKKNSTNDNISMKDINNFLIPIPPLAEQMHIVKSIDALLNEIKG